MRAPFVAIVAAAAPAHADDHGRVPIMITDAICDASPTPRIFSFGGHF